MNRRRVAIAVAAGVLLAACTSGTTTSTIPTTESTTTTTEGPLAPADVFAAVSPTLAFIETSIGTGSGVLMEDANLLTNAHVVWPYAEARVVFPDGTEITDAPVIAWDMMADLAVLDVSGAARLPDPALFGNGEELDIGSELYLIGYPAEVEEFPQPTLTRGILSRLRSWEAIDVTYLQTDAVIAGGQSGGALVSDRGEVIGISGLLFAEGFGLAASAPDVLPRIEQALDGVNLDDLSDRTLTSEGTPAREAEATLANSLDEATWLFTPPQGEEVTLEARSAADVSLSVVSADGFVEVFADQSESDPETGSFEVVVDAPHVVAVTVLTPGRSTVTVTSDVPLAPFTDPDHGTAIRPGETLAGNIDYPTDVDYFLIDLEAGQTVTIGVDTINFDADLIVDLADNEAEALATDADSGGGIMGWNPEVTFTAERTDTHIIAVFDQTGVGPGGYFLSVEES